MPRADYDQARAMLRFVAPSDHETRYRVGMALYDGLGEHGFPLFDEWLARHDKYRTELRSWGRSHWRGLGRGGRSRGVGFGTLVHLAREAGWQGDYRPPQPTPEERRAEQQRRAAAERQRQASAQNAKQRAGRMLREAKLATHPYLASKGFPAELGFVYDGLLLLPIRELIWTSRTVGGLRSLQTITPDGEKRYLFGSDLMGGGIRLGAQYPREIFYCEGYATALSIREALRALPGDEWAVVACMSSAGLGHEAARHGRGTRRRPRWGYVLADHDDWLCANHEVKPHRWLVDVGVEQSRCPACGSADRLKRPAGEAAALKARLPWVAPVERGDFNDLHQDAGVEYVVQTIRRLRATGRADTSLSKEGQTRPQIAHSAARGRFWAR